VEVRECKHHGAVEFGNYSAGNGKFRWMCKPCIAEAVTRRHQKIKCILVAEAGGRCAICGYARSVVNLHFHHVDPSTKLFAVSTASGKALATWEAPNPARVPSTVPASDEVVSRWAQLSFDQPEA